MLSAEISAAWFCCCVGGVGLMQKVMGEGSTSEHPSGFMILTRTVDLQLIRQRALTSATLCISSKNNEGLDKFSRLLKDIRPR